jgi:hypothetical protein
MNSAILRREFPQLPRTFSASKAEVQKNVFFAMHSVSPTEKCSFLYVWWNCRADRLGLSASSIV